MKNLSTPFAIACVGVLALAGTAMGDGLRVTHAAAMGGGAAQNDCAVALNPDGTDATAADNEAGPCGLEIIHGGTNTGASVVDNSPNAEQVYRFSFLMNPNDMVGGDQFTPVIFRAKGDNPNPGGGRCPTNALAQVDSIAIRAKFLQSGYAVALRINDNFCGGRGTPDVSISPNTASKICGEVIHAKAGQGLIAIAIVAPGNPCPTSGDPAYTTAANSNSSLMNVNRISMGIHDTHPASKHVNPIYFDEFESFRTLAP